MYAVIKTGGKQYRVSVGQVIRLEKLPNEAGDEMNFTDVLMLTDGEAVQVGTPLLEKATVTAKVMDHGRAKKVNILKFKRRKHHMKRQGHRQSYTQVKIVSISA